MKGFTVIEVAIVIAIIAILGVIAFGAANGVSSGSKVSWGWNGITETRCIDGLKFVIGEGGQARQIYDQFGKGVACGQVEK